MMPFLLGLVVGSVVGCIAVSMTMIARHSRALDVIEAALDEIASSQPRSVGTESHIRLWELIGRLRTVRTGKR